MEKKIISIIIASYNHEKFIRETLDSIFNQRFHSFEVIVIDDGSTDNSVEVISDYLSKYSFKLITQKNRGVCATINSGIELSTGDYIVLHASDDIMPPGRLEEQFYRMSKNASIDILTGRVRYISEDSKLIGESKLVRSGVVNLSNLLSGNYLFAPTAMFKKSVFVQFGQYPENLLFEDYYMWLNVVSRKGNILVDDAIWCDYRVFNRSSSLTKVARCATGRIQILEMFYHLSHLRVSLQVSKEVVKLGIVHALSPQPDIKSRGLPFKALFHAIKFVANCLNRQSKARIITRLVSDSN